MGHATAYEFVELDEIPDSSTNCSVFGRIYRSLEDRIVGVAIEKWEDEEPGSANAGESVMLKPAPEELANDAINQHFKDKGGYYTSPIVPIISTKDYEVKTKIITIKLVGDEWARHTHDGWRSTVVWEKINEALPELKGRIVEGTIIYPEGTRQNEFDNRPGLGWTVRSTVDADTSGGKAITVYRLLIDGKTYAKTEYATQALARAAGVKMMEESSTIQNVEVMPRIVREDGTSVVKLTRKTKQATAKYKVEYIQMKTEKPTTTKYFVAFDYHH